jgi:hypothetical protein
VENSFGLNVFCVVDGVLILLFELLCTFLAGFQGVHFGWAMLECIEYDDPQFRHELIFWSDRLLVSNQEKLLKFCYMPAQFISKATANSLQRLAVQILRSSVQAVAANQIRSNQILDLI